MPPPNRKAPAPPKQEGLVDVIQAQAEHDRVSKRAEQTSGATRKKLQQLLKKVKQPKDVQDAFHLAAKLGQFTCLQVLLDAGAAVDAPDGESRGKTALCLALERGHPYNPCNYVVDGVESRRLNTVNQ